MKKFLIPIMAGAICFSTACNNAENDSVDVAEDQNEQRADNANTGDGFESDSDFMIAAANGGLFEVEAGKLAGQKASNKQVKDFGQMMVSHHSTANDELKSLAGQKNIAIPATPGEDKQQKITGLQEKSGNDFDKEYMETMVNAHEEDVRKFERAAENATDPDIKAFAGKTLPTLKQHLEQARTIRDGLK